MLILLCSDDFSSDRNSRFGAFRYFPRHGKLIVVIIRLLLSTSQLLIVPLYYSYYYYHYYYYTISTTTTSTTTLTQVKGCATNSGTVLLLMLLPVLLQISPVEASTTADLLSRTLRHEAGDLFQTSLQYIYTIVISYTDVCIIIEDLFCIL